jgi:alpha-beta hydrolase superfamily lysophospholipase
MPPIKEARYFALFCFAFIILFVLLFFQQQSETAMQSWHTEKFSEEFTAQKTDKIKTFTDYLQLEERLFKQLNDKIYSQEQLGSTNKLERYTTGSAADFHNQKPDWNRSFELITDKPRGAVLLLHGMSDSPYSLRTLGQTLNEQNYRVVGLRLPGHGTAPSGLRSINRYDMAAATRLAMTHLANKMSGKPIYIIGYSTGATLALEYTLDALEGKTGPVPAKLVLISPAIGVHSLAALARFKNALSNLPGLDNLAFLQIQTEFDPYKYNSFASNAADVVYRLTRSVAQRIKNRSGNNVDWVLPPTLVLKSTVDATVTNTAVVDNLLNYLKPNRHELVLFDINRFAVVRAKLLIDDPAPFTDRLMQDSTLPFTTTFVTNKHANTNQVISKTNSPFSNQIASSEALGLSWPVGIISLSHVALPISPLDLLYGQRPSDNDDFIFLGQMAIQGELGLLKIPSEWMLRLRYNPFYDFLESKTLKWLENPDYPCQSGRTR